MNSVAIIPARGGSKRIPKKNIKPFLGKPIIAYSIEAARESRLFDTIIVSTDSEEIAQVARSYGAQVPFMRPKELADDFTGTNAVVKHGLECLMANGQKPKYACCIYATAPFVQVKYLAEGYQKLVQSQRPFVFSVTEFGFPIQRAIKITPDGEVQAFYPQYIKTRSQDLEKAYHDAGQFYWGQTDAFLNEQEPYASQSLPVILPPYLVQDIDTLKDWQMAELKYKVLKASDFQ